ncbi:hypothetical protein KL86DYS1_30279 [uncultured Dysgonomonas sp.]|uniref:Uncharacterized protein n=1 Tax=uncultured Dysgonomonas sp. TaxID=206096 RepID=A0A212JSE5_9BACT|nr:hypothetical protein KL86DYS1_30279 [uncultured Dysgonomonas sp.]
MERRIPTLKNEMFHSVQHDTEGIKNQNLTALPRGEVGGAINTSKNYQLKTIS